MTNLPISFSDGALYKSFMLGTIRYAWCSRHGAIAIVDGGVWSESMELLIYFRHNEHKHQPAAGRLNGQQIATGKEVLTDD